MKTKMIGLLAALFVMGHVSAFAQPGNNDKKGEKPRPTPEEQLQRHCQRMAEMLMLDDATAAQFISLYGDYLKAMDELRKGDLQPASKEEPVAHKELTDEEIEKQIEQSFDQSRKLLDIREKYYPEFKKILSSKQLLRIYRDGNAGFHDGGKPGFRQGREAAFGKCGYRGERGACPIEPGCGQP